jgi:hypothetical protein
MPVNRPITKEIFDKLEKFLNGFRESNKDNKDIEWYCEESSDRFVLLPDELFKIQKQQWAVCESSICIYIGNVEYKVQKKAATSLDIDTYKLFDTFFEWVLDKKLEIETAKILNSSSHAKFERNTEVLIE